MLKKIIREGFPFDSGPVIFKNKVNKFFRNIPESILNVLKSKEKSNLNFLLKYDDRLNCYFIFSEFRPQVGLYLDEKENKIRVINFNNKHSASVLIITLIFLTKDQKEEAFSISRKFDLYRLKKTLRYN